MVSTSQSHCKTSTLCVTRLQKCRKAGCMLQNVKTTELDEIFSSNIWAVEALCFWLHDSRQGMGLSTDWAELVHAASSGQPGYFLPPSTAKVQQGCTFGGCSYIQIFKDQTKRRGREVEFTQFCSWSGCSWVRLCLCSPCRAGKRKPHSQVLAGHLTRKTKNIGNTKASQSCWQTVQQRNDLPVDS